MILDSWWCRPVVVVVLILVVLYLYKFNLYFCSCSLFVFCIQLKWWRLCQSNVTPKLEEDLHWHIYVIHDMNGLFWYCIMRICPWDHTWMIWVCTVCCSLCSISSWGWWTASSGMVQSRWITSSLSTSSQRSQSWHQGHKVCSTHQGDWNIARSPRWAVGCLWSIQGDLPLHQLWHFEACFNHLNSLVICEIMWDWDPVTVSKCIWI